MPLEGTFLRFTEDEKNRFEDNEPGISKFIKKVIGGEELLRGLKRYCFWIDNEDLDEALSFNEIARRVEQVKNFRVNGGDVARTLVNRSHQFRYRTIAKESMIVLPCTSSETRQYIPSQYFDNSYISLNSTQIIYDAEPWIFGVISSLMHMAWVRAVGGSLETRIRYSSVLCYNTFPFPNISQKQKDEITEFVFAILDEREKHSQKTLAQLYDPDKMPEGLKKAHHNLDIAIEQCYRPKPFESDEERLEYLFKMYEEMTSKEGK